MCLIHSVIPPLSKDFEIWHNWMGERVGVCGKNLFEIEFKQEVRGIDSSLSLGGLMVLHQLF